MNARQNKMLESLQNAKAFLDQNAGALPNVENTSIRKRLDDALVELNSLMLGQAGHTLQSQGSTRKSVSLRETLMRDHMAPIAGVARAELPRTPELEPLRLPHARSSYLRLVAAADAMGKAAEPFSAVFLAAGLPQDFIAQLNAAADAMVKSTVNRNQTTKARVGVTNGLSTGLASARKTVAALDKVVSSTLKNDSTLLANWKSAKRVKRSPLPATPAAPTTPTAPTASAPTAVTT